MLRSMAFALLLVLPLAAAGPTPVIGFFDDSADGPVGDGVIVDEWPDSEDAKARAILPELFGQQVVAFEAEDAPGTHLKGPVFAGIWPDAGVAKDSYIRMVVSVDDEVMAESTVLVNLDESAAPDPTTLIPPDPSDPESAVYYEMAQVMPLILQPPTLIDMGTLDIEVPDDAVVKVAMSLIGPDGTPPTGVSVLLKYDSTLSPSFVYLPWWSADPEAESPQVAALEEAQADEPQAPVAPADEPDDAGPASTPAGEDSPGVGVVALVGLVAVASVLRRRKV